LPLLHHPTTLSFFYLFPCQPCLHSNVPRTLQRGGWLGEIIYTEPKNKSPQSGIPPSRKRRLFIFFLLLVLFLCVIF
jgi:hypothetical protein